MAAADIDVDESEDEVAVREQPAEMVLVPLIGATALIALTEPAPIPTPVDSPVETFDHPAPTGKAKLVDNAMHLYRDLSAQHSGSTPSHRMKRLAAALYLAGYGTETATGFSLHPAEFREANANAVAWDKSAAKACKAVEAVNLAAAAVLGVAIELG